MQIEDRPEGDSIRPTETHGDFLWGADAISKAIGRGKWPTYYLLEAGQLKCAKKLGGRWVCSRAALLRELGAAS